MRHCPRLSLLLATAFLASFPLAGQAQVVISQAYGGGGNSGATFTHDFVELFNRGSSPASLNGSSLQYASAAGNFSNVFVLPNTTLQPGQYYLVQLAGGANGVALPVAPDVASTALNLAGASGKIALVRDTAALGCGGSTLACSPTQLGLMADLLGYGSVSLSEGGANGPALNNTSSARRRGGGCTDTDNNGADFEAVSPPAPRNTSAPALSCPGGGTPTDPIASGAASPASLLPGETTLLTVTVVPGTNPASSGLQVTADLGPIGGPAAQAFSDDGNNGDAVAGDSVFSHQFTLGASLAPGPRTLPVSVSDAEARTATTSINLSIVGRASISEIQGQGIGTPLPLNTNVVTEGIVTALRSNGYFIQSAPSDEDSDPATAEGLFVFTSAAPPAEAVVGHRLRVAGRVTQFLRTPHGYPLTQLSNASATVLSTGNPLPPEVVIDPAYLQADAPLSSLGRYQGMRVQLPQARVVGATKGGVFFVTLPDAPRPVREPGIAALDVVPLPIGNSIPRFDKNPERLRVEGRGLANAPAADLSVDAGTLMQGLRGVMYYEEGDFTVLAGDRTGLTTSGGADIAAVPLPADGAVRIASYNIENLSGGAFVPLARLEKLSEVFCQYLRLPDVVGLVEIANLATAARLAQAINDNEFGDCPESPQYSAYLLSNSGSQRLAYLVKTAEVAPGVPRVQVESVTEEFVADTLTAPNNTPNGVLFDRPPLYLQATVNAANGRQFPIHVVVNHTLSLLDINDLGSRADSWVTTGARSRGKRLQQAIRLSELVEAIQTSDPAAPLVLVGDYNAYDFSDGYVDVVGIISGNPAPANEVLAHGASAVTRPLHNLLETRPVEQRYSYVFEGNKQAIDHALVNDVVMQVTEPMLYHPRINADFATDLAADPGTPLRTSDHDPVVAELVVPSFIDTDLTVAVSAPAGPLKDGSIGRFVTRIHNRGAGRAIRPELTLLIDAHPRQITSVQAPGWECGEPMATGTRSTIFCGRLADLPGAQGTGNLGDTVHVDVMAERHVVRDQIRVQATVATDSNDVATQNDQASAVVKVTGRPRWTH